MKADLNRDCTLGSVSRRQILQSAVTTSAFVASAAGALPKVSFAREPEADPYGKEGRAAFESVSVQTPANPRSPDSDIPFVTLDSGVKFKEFKEGTGPQVTAGSRVSVQLTGRLLNLNGVKFFSTKDGVQDPLLGYEPLVFTAGAGQVVPGLDEAVLGMKKGGIRRVVVPARLGYSAGQNLEPQPRSVLDRNALNSVLQNPRRDASVMFDVVVERVK